jgi:cyclopropane fatty-acyl-phospholipid synthase-like methyltransferase
LASSLPLDATIFETACGSGANLLWLAQKGFRKLHGIDISNEALWLCQGLAQLKRVHLDVWQENALSPSNSKTRDLFSQGIDAILSLSWLQHVPNADLGEFLKIYHPCLNLDGIIIFDMITHDYDTVRNNQYHSDDWNLPVSQRRPSEYRMRMSTEEIQDLAKNTGYIYERGITLMTLISGHPQRSVHMLRRSGSWTGLPNLSG